ncbi:MAG: Nup93/Nic96-domain-containing protein [Benjaminiella poitrasii]|nr:MAG: Nup93/Nic96-domain-containing protein [Benjaminiella poitrasii]
MNTLRQLRERAQLLLSPSDRGDLPVIQKSIDQIEREIKAMSEKIRPTQELHAKAHYFLASNGINTEHVSTPINTSRTFEIAELDNHTDIKKFLAEEHEKILIDIIEEQRKVNDDEFEKFYENQFEKFSKNMERERMEEDENMADYKEFEKYNNTTGIARISEYADIVSQLNNNRLIDVDFDLIRNLSNIRNMSELQRFQDHAFDAWNILGHVVNKSNIDGRLEGRFTRNYIAEPYQSVAAIQARRSLIGASKSWLEQQTAQYINESLNRNAKRIKVGGIPSFNYRLRAYIDLVFKNGSEWTDDRLEIVKGLPIWVFIFLLMRSGHLDLAAKYVDSHREMFVNDKKFVSYFEQYVNAEDHCVSKATQDEILQDYYRFEYGERVVDPYKLLIYKIIGRCELHKFNLPNTIQTIEDYVWLQLMLARENNDAVVKLESERFSLIDVQKNVTKNGGQYYNQEDSNPWIYFKILLLSLQFEKAIDYLYQQKYLRLETIHFAITLVYHEYVYTLNYPRLIYQYVQTFIQQNAKNALQYLYTLSLYSPKQGYPDQSMVQLAKSYIHKFSLSSNDYQSLLGSETNGRIPGLIEAQEQLLDIKTWKEYAEQILYPIADGFTHTGRCRDAVHVYSLTGDFNKMVDVLAKELSDALQQPQSLRATDPTLSELSNDEIIQFSVQIMEHYEKHEAFSKVIDNKRKQTIRTLIQLLQFRTMYEKGQLEHAIQILEQTNIIPFTKDFNQTQRLVDRFSHLDESILKNMPEILLNAMDILYKLWATYSSADIASAIEVHTLEMKVSALITFAGLIQFYIPGDIITRLNK